MAVAVVAAATMAAVAGVGIRPHCASKHCQCLDELPVGAGLRPAPTFLYLEIEAEQGRGKFYKITPEMNWRELTWDLLDLRGAVEKNQAGHSSCLIRTTFSHLTARFSEQIIPSLIIAEDREPACWVVLRPIHRR